MITICNNCVSMNDPDIPCETVQGACMHTFHKHCLDKWFVTKQNQGTNDAADSDINSSGVSQVVTLGAGEHNMTIDAGIYRKATVGDKVWDDMDHDNVQDGNEPGIANVLVKLLSSTGAVLKTTSTNSNGKYLFVDLDPGTYTLQYGKSNVMHY